MITTATDGYEVGRLQGIPAGAIWIDRAGNVTTDPAKVTGWRYPSENEQPNYVTAAYSPTTGTITSVRPTTLAEIAAASATPLTLDTARAAAEKIRTINDMLSPAPANVQTLGASMEVPAVLRGPVEFNAPGYFNPRAAKLAGAAPATGATVTDFGTAPNDSAARRKSQTMTAIGWGLLLAAAVFILRR